MLAGGQKILAGIRYVKEEEEDIETCVGACTLAMLSGMLEKQGFSEVRRHAFAHQEGVGTCYERKRRPV